MFKTVKMAVKGKDYLMTTNQNNLQHFGVLGMRWGRRRQRVKSSDYTTSRKIKSKRIEEMSNDEIKFLTNRLLLEQQLTDVTTAKRRKGMEAVGRILSGPLKNIATTVITRVVNQQVSKIFKTSASDEVIDGR